MGGPSRWNVGRLAPEGMGGGGPAGIPGEMGWSGGIGGNGSAGRGPRPLLAGILGDLQNNE